MPGLTTTVQNITSSPTPFVQVLENGVCPAGTRTNTNQSVLSSTNLTTRSTQVTISECETTELTFTNVDPPDNGTAGGTTATPTGTGTAGTPSGGGSTSSAGGSAPAASSGGGGGGGGGGGSSAGTGTTNTSTGTSTGSGVSTPAVVATSTGIGLSTTAGSSNTAAIKAELKKAAALANLKQTLKLDKGALKTLVKKLNATTNHQQKHHLKTQITALKAREAKVVLQITELEK